MKPRTLTRLILVGGLLGGLAACNPVGPGPIAGGPCSYETSVIEGTVTEVDEDGALFMGEEGEFWVLGRIISANCRTVGDTLTVPARTHHRRHLHAGNLLAD
jgi:hypothetical protein